MLQKSSLLDHIRKTKQIDLSGNQNGIKKESIVTIKIVKFWQ